MLMCWIAYARPFLVALMLAGEQQVYRHGCCHRRRMVGSRPQIWLPRLEGLVIEMMDKIAPPRERHHSAHPAGKLQTYGIES